MKTTFLYIKQHNKTGLKYFGKTTEDPYTYTGSGLHWKNHLRKHGNDVSTIWVKEFTDPTKLSEYALNFSKENDIVESKEWANLIPENGFDGAPAGNKLSPLSRTKMKDAWTPQRRAEQALRTKILNQNRQSLTCPHCGIVGKSPGNMKRYHYDNCNLIRPRQKKERRKIQNKMTFWTFRSPDGGILSTSKLREFCRLHSLNNGCMSDVANGNRKQYKGWTFVKSLTDDDISPEI
jgi:hypothetical protein